MEGHLDTPISCSSVRARKSLIRVTELIFIPHTYVGEDMEETIGIVGGEVVHYVQHKVVVTTCEVVVVTNTREVVVGIGLTAYELQTSSVIRVVPLTYRESCRPRKTIGELGLIVPFEEHSTSTTCERNEVIRSRRVSEGYAVSWSFSRCGLRGLCLCGQGRNPS